MLSQKQHSFSTLIVLFCVSISGFGIFIIECVSFANFSIVRNVSGKKVSTAISNPIKMFGPTATRMRLKSVIFGPVKETELSDHENSALVLTKYFLRPLYFNHFFNCFLYATF